MTESRKPSIRLLPTGIPGLDAVLGGGLPQYSFNLLAGDPGAGKTTLAQQILFSCATPEEPALYFTVLGEPPLKMLRHVQQYSFFDHDKVGSAIRFVNLGSEAMDEDLGAVLQKILAEVEKVHPAFVAVDSFRTVAHAKSEGSLQEFAQRLALHLTAWQATTFLIGEYARVESHTNPLFTVADGIFWLTQALEGSAAVRRLHVTKMRACASMPGLHTFVMSSSGIRVLPRQLPRAATPRVRHPKERASTGLATLDALMHGGIPRGQSILFAGPSGTGKSTFARHFVDAGARSGDKAILVAFEEHAGEYLAGTDDFGPTLREHVEGGRVELLALRPLDLTVDEALVAILDAVERTAARRLVLDSLSGFELALSPAHRQDVRESLFRLVSAITGRGITVLMTEDTVQSSDLRLSTHLTEFLADAIVLLRYVETDGQLEKALTVVKMRYSAHDTSIHPYTIDGSGIVLSKSRRFRSPIAGVPLVRTEEKASSRPRRSRARSKR